MQRIILLGFMGSGKTTIGKQLAEVLDFPFLDTDELIASKSGLSVNEFFSIHGEQAFREEEKHIIESLSSHPGFVLAVGGGLPAIPGMMQRLNELGTTIYLNVSHEELLRRLKMDRAERPLLKDHTERSLEMKMQELFSARESIYRQAVLVISNDRLTVDDVIDLLTLHQRN